QGEQAEITGGAMQVEGKLSLVLPACDVRKDLLGGEGPHGLAERAAFGGVPRIGGRAHRVTLAESGPVHFLLFFTEQDKLVNNDAPPSSVRSTPWSICTLCSRTCARSRRSSRTCSA